MLKYRSLPLVQVDTLLVSFILTNSSSNKITDGDQISMTVNESTLLSGSAVSFDHTKPKTTSCIFRLMNSFYSQAYLWMKKEITGIII